VTARFEVWGVDGIGEVGEDDDLAELIATAEPTLQTGDIVVVTSKIVSKSEGRMIAGDRERAIDAESVRLVAQRGDTRIVQTRHGFVLAAAGIDASNVPAGHVALLPIDPDASSKSIRDGLQSRLGVDVGVIVTDTFGRPWRNGLVDVAIGSAGVRALDDFRGRVDEHGHTLEMTVTAIADEIAAAAELVKGKLDGVPVAVVRGLAQHVHADAPPASSLVRAAEEDMFRLGTREAMRAGLFALTASEPTNDPVAAAMAGATPVADRPWRFDVEDERIVVRLTGDRTDAALLGVGAAIGNLLLALAHDGVTARWLGGDEKSRSDIVAVIALG